MARGRVIGTRHNRLIGRGARQERVREQILDRVATQVRELIYFTHVSARRHPSKPPTFVAGLFAVEEDAAIVAQTRGCVIEGAHRRQVSRAKASDLRCGACGPRAGGCVPEVEVIGRRKEIRTREDAPGALVDDPTRNECASRTMGTDDTVGLPQLLIDQQGERAVVVIEGPHTVGNPNHAIAIQGSIAGRQYREGRPIRRHHSDVRRLRAGRARRGRGEGKGCGGERRSNEERSG